MNSTLIENVYNNYATFYDIIFSKTLDQGRRRAIKQMEIKSNEKVIEFGVGTGLSFKHYNFFDGVSLTGIDLSKKMLAKAMVKAEKYKNLEINLDCIDGENTPYLDSSFDKVVLMYVYSVTPNPELLLKEAIRICKNEGNIYIINHFSNCKNKKLNVFEKLLSKYSNVVGFRSEFSYVDYIEKLNLTIENEETANLFSLTKIIHLKKNNNIHLLN